MEVENEQILQHDQIIDQNQFNLLPVDTILTAQQLLEQEKQFQNVISTGVQKFDQILGGGILVGYISEIYGEAGSGKTQFGINSVLNSVITYDQNGNKQFNGSGVYISFRKDVNQKRLEQLHETFKRQNNLGESVNFLEQNQVQFVNLLKFQDFIDFIEKSLENCLQQGNFKILVIDEIANLIREEFSEKQYHEKQNFISQFILKMKILAHKYAFAVLIINSVVSDAENRNTDSGKQKLLPAIGAFWTSQLNERFKISREERKEVYINQEQQLQKQYFQDQNKNQIIKRQLKVKFSPRLQRQSVSFTIDNEGFQ
ncbi:P-loop containing nucleoside triphosphate hydrolase [Pseudocohnilembus persalinus]|uniref:p-loop containing nucleoside triphosphate hydrolase n=1 Tax=Pseudocohnilembus persalinus TaxID=266149 RepID=A0A0V0R218_PSEPJ|nr:P-loop containing nucleoside triphosphate hydrolase [Pseudocohnilembus persalinus]|eukprot:KRX08362.1 P-loop containing nucleoside triphosphate hydrolase [Pseudocohnilembus persalinus]